MRIGVDLGGTKIEAIALDDDGEIRTRLRVPTPREAENGYEAIVDAVANLVGAVERAAGSTGTVGIGIPGTLSEATGLVKNANTVVLNGRPLDRDLATRLGRPVRLANDANCFALSEAVDGAAAPLPGERSAEGRLRVVFGVIMGTGTGGGVVIGDRPLVGLNGIGGEWGHNPLPWPRDDERPGPACYCGKSGCIETFLSGPGVRRDHEAATGRTLEPAAIARAAEAHDAAAEGTMQRLEDRLARGLASIINVLDPDVIVLGGGLSNLGRLYTGVPERWGRYVFSDTVRTRLVRAQHGDSSGVRGAAWLWPR